jgi:hypothetical protein
MGKVKVKVKVKNRDVQNDTHHQRSSQGRVHIQPYRKTREAKSKTQE